MAINPELEAAIAHLAKETVAHGWDAGRVCAWLVEVIRFRNEVWPKLSKQERALILREIQRQRRDAERRLREMRNE